MLRSCLAISCKWYETDIDMINIIFLLLHHRHNEIVKIIVSHHFIYANHFDGPGVKAAICKINKFSIATSIYPKYYCTQLSCAKTFVEKFSFSELKIENVKFVTQSPTKIFCIGVFNVGGCLASCF